MKLNKLKVRLEAVRISRPKFWRDYENHIIVQRKLKLPMDNFTVKILYHFADYLGCRIYPISYAYRILNKDNLHSLHFIGAMGIGSPNDLANLENLWTKWYISITSDIETKGNKHKIKLRRAKSRKYYNRKSYKNLKPYKVYIEDLKSKYLDSIKTIFKDALVRDFRINRRKIKSLVNLYIRKQVNLKNKKPVKHPQIKINRFIN